MSGTSRQHDHVARLRGDCHARIAAKENRYLARIDAEDLVAIRVVMVERVDAVSPGGRPAIAREELLERFRRRRLEHAGIDEQRPARMVGNLAVRREQVGHDVH